MLENCRGYSPGAKISTNQYAIPLSSLLQGGEGRKRRSRFVPICGVQEWTNRPAEASCWIKSNSSRFSVRTGMPALAAARKISASFRHSLR